MKADSTVSGVLLAAGPSSRLGSASPKQLLQIGGEALVRRIARRALSSRLAEVIVVVGYEAESVAAALEGLRVRIVLNRDYLAGQSSSVGVGLGAVALKASGALFMPVDQPHLDVDLINGLIDLFEATGGPIVVPSFAGSRGAPVLFSRSLFTELRRLEGDAGGRQLFPAHEDRIVELSLANGTPLRDLDTPTDLDRLDL